MATDPIILDYHNSLIKESDLRLLKFPNWLNDTIIGFAFEYFENFLFKEFTKKAAFISPDTVQFLKLGLSEDDIRVCLEPLDLPSKDIIFLPINNNRNTQSTGGSHWSLLVLNKAEGQFQHYDSSSGMNSEDARLVAKALGTNLGGKPASFKDMNSPQQVNSSDCGMYVICITKHLCEKYVKDKAIDFADVTPEFVKNERDTLKMAILELSAKGS